MLSREAGDSFHLTTWLVVGLGNPGEAYRLTPHNVGFRLLDELAANLAKGVAWQQRPGGLYLRFKNIILLKPTTYMNNSGDAVASFASYFKVALESIIVIYDEVYLPRGRVKLSYASSSGGHNGIASVVARLGSANFYRVRVGVGPRPEYIPLKSYVLRRMSGDEEARVALSYHKIQRLVTRLVEGVAIKGEFNWFNHHPQEGS